MTHRETEWSETRLSSLPEKRQSECTRESERKTHVQTFLFSSCCFMCAHISFAIVRCHCVRTYVHFIVGMSGPYVLLSHIEAPLWWYYNPAV